MKIYSAAVVGESHENEDGSNRQKILSRSKAGESITLVREPDNPYDPGAVRVDRSKGGTIGYLERGSWVSSAIDEGKIVRARIKEITGGPPLHYGCVLEVSIGESEDPAAERTLHAGSFSTSTGRRRSVREQRLEEVGQKLQKTSETVEHAGCALSKLGCSIVVLLAIAFFLWVMWSS